MRSSKFYSWVGTIALLAIVGFGCSTNNEPTGSANNSSKDMGSVTVAGPYSVTLESVVDNGDGTWTWTWSVQNPNPGNGKNGQTVQDLSHWTMDLGQCANIDDVESGAYSTDGTNWTAFTPTWAPDPSMCNTCGLNCGVDVLKFGIGTSGSAKTYYQLVLNTEYEPATVTGWYKSGKNTGCGTFTFEGIGCPPDDGPGPQCTANTCDNPGPFPYTFSAPDITYNGNGTWTWIWQVTNSNPGNGSGGTFQNMSHWVTPFNACLENCGGEDVVIANAWSANGVDWTEGSGDYAADNSFCAPGGNANCAPFCGNTPVLKFDMGTTGSATSYYRIVVNQDLDPQLQIAWYKSGSNTGCGCFNFWGPGCPED